MFLQIHTLTPFGPSLLNRDQDGYAKRIPFGGASRLRVSSQCLKRHWRTHRGPFSLSTIPLEDGVAPLTVRSRLTFRELVRERMVREHQIAPQLATEVTEEMMRFLLGESVKAKAKEEAVEEPEKGKKTKGKKKDDEPAQEDTDACRTNQLTILGQTEINFIYEQTCAIARVVQAKPSTKIPTAIAEHFTFERKKNLRGLLLGAGLDAALFGRMVTSKSLDNVDAAVQVAHSLTVHAALTEPDFFSAVDDLEREMGNKGSGHIGQSELATGLFYGYVTVDVPLLLSNLTGRPVGPVESDRLLETVVSRLVHLITTVSPGAKLGSTAPHAYAQLVLIEKGTQQPRTLANAYLRAVPNSQDLLENSYRALAKHLDEMMQMFGERPDYRFAAMGPVQALGPALKPEHRLNVPDLATWAGSF